MKMQYFIFLILHAVLSMEVVPVRKKVKDLTFDEMFLSNLQQHLHRGDMEGAFEAVQKHELTSVVYPGERRRKKNLGDHLPKEQMTEEAYRLPTFDSLKEAKDAFKDTPEARISKEAKRDKLKDRVENLKGQREQIKTMIEQVNAKEITPKNTAILKQLQKLETENKASLNTTLENLIEVMEDMIKRDKFIDENPKLFLKKEYFAKDQFGLERAKKRMKCFGDGQVIRIDDSFSKTMPESLKRQCVNSNKFTNSPETNPPTHGIAVASVAVDKKIGVAPNAKFNASDYISDQFPKVLGPFSERPSGVTLIPVSGSSLGEFEVRALEICLRDEKAKFACQIGGDYFTIDTSTFKPFPETIINLSNNFSDSITRDRINKPNKHVAYLLAYASMIYHWIKQGKLIVWGAGNEGTTVGSSGAYSVLRIFSEVYPTAFIVVLSVEKDHTTLSNFTNQPGRHTIQACSLCAPGEDVFVMRPDGSYVRDSGTSFSAPFISGVIALLSSNYPKATNAQIISALLDTATPIVMMQRKGRRYESPYALRDIRSKELFEQAKFMGPDDSIKHVYINAEGKEKIIMVTKEMVKKGREKYGVGLVNVSGALRALENIYGPIRF